MIKDKEGTGKRDRIGKRREKKVKKGNKSCKSNEINKTKKHISIFKK
jgi:hypothetical protein